MNDISEDIFKKLENTKKELGECYCYVNDGIKIRSRASWYESGERDSRYFNQLMQNNIKKSTIKKIKTLDGAICSDEKVIAKEIRNVYGKLYSKTESENSEDYDAGFFSRPTKIKEGISRIL